MLLKRVITALIGIPIAIYTINFGSWLFAAVVSALALLAWHEFCIMLNKQKISPMHIYGMIGILLLLGCAWLGNSYETIMIIFIFTIITLMKVVLNCVKFSIADAAFSLFGFIYIGLSFAHLIMLRFLEFPLDYSGILGALTAGTAFVWIAFIGTWASDTFAFFVGSKWGKHKLCPALSPGKTREGALGGVAGSIFVVLLLGQLLNLQVMHSLTLGLLIGIVAPVGDLAESALKRFAGVKDSGKLLPGHGGVLDRFDSIMLSVPVVYYYVSLILL